MASRSSKIGTVRTIGPFAGGHRLSALGAALAASGLLTAMPAAWAYNTDASEPGNDNPPTAMSAVVGTLYEGCVGDTFTDTIPAVGPLVDPTQGCVHDAAGGLGNDPADFLRWTGLLVGSPYSMTTGEFALNPNGDKVNFALFSDAAATSPVSFSGTVSSTGILTLRLTPEGLAEGYTAQLTAQTASVPEPATAALLAAGLVGAFVVRRRKRS